MSLYTAKLSGQLEIRGLTCFWIICGDNGDDGGDVGDGVSGDGEIHNARVLVDVFQDGVDH